MSTDLTDDELMAMWIAENVPERSIGEDARAFARAAIAADRDRRAYSAAAVPAPTLVAVPGAVWGFYGEDGVSLIQRGTEDARIAKAGGERLYRVIAATPAPPQAVPATDAEHQSKGGAAIQVLHELGYTYEAGAWFAPAAPVAVDAADVPEADFGKMPPLPKPRTLSRGDEDGALQLGYTADQTLEYGQACRAAGAGSREPLTDAEIDAMWDAETVRSEDRSLPRRWLRFARAIERAHGIGGKA